MKWLNITFFALVIITVIISVNCNTVKDEQSQVPGDSLTVSNINFYWKAESESLHVRLSAPTTGWVSAGFDPTAGQGMQDADYIIGYVVNDSVFFIQDNYGDSPTTHLADTLGGGFNNVKPIKGTESNGRTEIEFMIPLNSGDTRDRVLVVGNTYSVQLAYGPNDSDDFESLHEFYVVVSIKI
jgi:hypothetical protein